MVEEKQSAPATQATDDMPVTEAHDILYRALGIGREILIAYPGPAQREATLEELTLISTTPDGRALRATPQTATSWLELQRAAASASPPGPPSAIAGRARASGLGDGCEPGQPR